MSKSHHKQPTPTSAARMSGERGSRSRSGGSSSSSRSGSVTSVASSASSGPSISPDARSPYSIWGTPEHVFFKSSTWAGAIEDVNYEAGASPEKDILMIVCNKQGGSIPHTRFPFLPDRLALGRLLHAYREAAPSQPEDTAWPAKQRRLARAKQQFLKTYTAFRGNARALSLIYKGATYTELRKQAVAGCDSSMAIRALPYTFEWYGQQACTTTSIIKVKLGPHNKFDDFLYIRTQHGTFSSVEFLDLHDRGFLAHLEELLIESDVKNATLQAKFRDKYQVSFNEGCKKLVFRSDYSRKERSAAKKAWIEYGIMD